MQLLPCLSQIVKPRRTMLVVEHFHVFIWALLFGILKPWGIQVWEVCPKVSRSLLKLLRSHCVAQCASPYASLVLTLLSVRSSLGRKSLIFIMAYYTCRLSEMTTLFRSTVFAAGHCHLCLTTNPPHTSPRHHSFLSQPYKQLPLGRTTHCCGIRGQVTRNS